jgi:hypothetical protein
MAVVITAVRPADVAREVDRMVRIGEREFVLVPVARGGMLDQERLGAARYAAGRQAEVELSLGEAAQRR